MRNFTLFLLGMFFTFTAAGQFKAVTPPQPPPQKIKCYTFESMQDFRAKHPGAETDAQFESWLHQKIQLRNQQRINAYYVIPIVFHVIHNGEPVGTSRNLDAAQIQQQLNQLNADFANLSGSTQGAAADAEIQFCLATIDNLGNPMGEPGIDRIDRNSKGWVNGPYNGLASNSYVDETIMPESIWDPTKYYNVWTLELDNGLLGKATFPASSTIPDLPALSTDNATHSGVFVDFNSVGSVCTPGFYGTSFGLGRTLTHETGHYLGLRHIWGDALCGNDFCADTPTQDEETNGCPNPGTLNGCTPSVPKMFENYMDYTDDPCVNTLTQDQKTRMQTVMANSPRRMTLPGAGSCNGAAANAIRFNYVCAQASETGTGSVCPRFRDVLVNVNVFAAANGNATVNFTKGGTATENVDYTIIPSSLSYVNGNNLPKTITIRIWDDAIVESSETLVLEYTITGTGVVAGTENQIFTLTINDDDAVLPTINNAGVEIIFSEDFEGTGGALPLDWRVGPFIDPAGINEWVISSNGGAGITGQSAHITNNVATKPLAYDQTSESDAGLVSPMISTTGYLSPRLSFTYKCNGEFQDFGVLMYSFDGGDFFVIFDPNGVPYGFQGTSAATAATNLVLPPELLNTNFFLCFRWLDNGDGSGANPPFLVDNIVISDPTTTLESQTTNPGSELVFNGQDVYILSDADGQLITRIQNASTDLNCVTAAVTQQGVNKINISTTSGLYQRSEKVVTITPSPANTTATYDVTLYFSTAEVSVAQWGNDLTGVKIMKVADGVNLTTTTFNTSNAQLVSAVIDDQRATKGYASFTGNFTGGFSQFFIVTPATTLPVQLITFEAKAVRRSIVLNWSTSQELNNKGFGIERSMDGANYVKIGWVDGKINSNTRTDYTYTDNFVQPGITYYYRLRQTDIDDKEKVSAVRQAKINENGGVFLTINPNPAKDEVKLFISGSSAAANVTLVNMQGQVMRKWAKVNASGAPLPLNISGLASGVYLLEVQLAEEKLVERIVIK